MVILLLEEIHIPDIQVVSCVDIAVLPPGEPEDQRPVAVAGLGTTTWIIRVPTRSSTERGGIPHPCPETLGLSKTGKFPGRAKSLGKLGTLRNVRSTVILDYQRFEAVCAGFP
jgi:hypothetical protein